MKRTVVISLFGTTLDNLRGEHRWERWRPTVSLGQHDDLLIDRLELLTQEKYAEGAAITAADIRQVSPETTVKIHRVEYKDPWDFEEVYTTLLDFARSYPFDLDNEDYLVHLKHARINPEGSFASPETPPMGVLPPRSGIIPGAKDSRCSACPWS